MSFDVASLIHSVAYVTNLVPLWRGWDDFTLYFLCGGGIYSLCPVVPNSWYRFKL